MSDWVLNADDEAKRELVAKSDCVANCACWADATEPSKKLAVNELVANNDCVANADDDANNALTAMLAVCEVKELVADTAVREFVALSD